MRSKSTKTRILVWSIVGAIVVSVAALLLRQLLQPDLKKQVAVFMHAKPENVQLNLPPAAGRYPGGMLAISEESSRVVEFVNANDQELVPGELYTVDWNVGTLAATGAETAFERVGSLVHSSAVSGVELSLKQARTLEMAEEKLKERLLKRASVRRKTEDLYIITRAVEAIPVLRLRRAEAAAGDAWISMKKDATGHADVKATAESGSSDALTVELKTPVVVAYEISRAAFFSTSLGTQPDDVKLIPLTEPELNALEKKKPLP